MRWQPHRRLIGMISPLIVWAFYFIVVYVLAGLRCGAPPAREAQIAESAWRTGLAIGTLLALGLIALLGVAGWRRWRLHAVNSEAMPAKARGRQRFMGLVMLGLALLSAIATVLTGLPILMLAPCE